MIQKIYMIIKYLIAYGLRKLIRKNLNNIIYLF